MKKRLWLLLITCFIMGTLSGFGGKSAGFSGSGAVSAGGVSTGAVSGGGVSDLAATTSLATEKAGTFCNDRYVYYKEGFELVERPLAGGTGRRTAIEDLSYVCYADNDWGYYIKENINDDRYQIWRAPVIRSEGWRLHADREELVLEDKQGFEGPPGEVWCNGKYIVYISGETYKYREYDIRGKNTMTLADWTNVKRSATSPSVVKMSSSLPVMRDCYGKDWDRMKSSRYIKSRHII